ncbi:MAG: glycosyltransferase [Euzebyales bacterium]|nr:glycosyltransferase [Euzebyales bacterium]
MHLSDVTVPVADLEHFSPLIGEERLARLRAAAASAREAFAGRTVWNVNSTASGGGVAEMLAALLPYARGAGVDARWIVITGDAPFFAITKRVHNGLHGVPGAPFGRADRSCYEAVTHRNAEELVAEVQAGDVVILHDPQTAGLVEPMTRVGAKVVWRCHIGIDRPDEVVTQTWAFLRPYLESADAYVFSRTTHVPDWAPADRVHIVPPSIDPFAVKNAEMDPAAVRAILAHTGIVLGDGETGPPVFTRRDGSPGRVDHRADVIRTGPPPSPETPLVVQVSRWDRLKDMAGVMAGFAEHTDPGLGAHLALVGPNVSGVTDDPEGGEVLDACHRAWRELPHAERARVQLVCLPMYDLEENAAIVNAVQRHAAVVVQKSLAEGFGLTVAEAMWKARPMVASAVGGIADQIVDGDSGVLLHDPTDGAALGAALDRLVGDPEAAGRLGEAARQRVVERFLGERHLRQYADLLGSLLGG